MDARIFIEKKPHLNQKSQQLVQQIQQNLRINGLQSIRLIHLYDLFDLQNAEQLQAVKKVLAEAVSDKIYDDINLQGLHYFATEFLPGQFDQCADSAKQCIDIALAEQNNVQVKSGQLLIFEGQLTAKDIEKIKDFYINPIESQLKDLSQLALAPVNFDNQEQRFTAFCQLDQQGLAQFKQQLNLALTLEDLAFIQTYFIQQDRAPTEAEIRTFDAYWSDHCRHTTFETEITAVTFPDNAFGQKLQQEYEDYLALQQQLARHKKPSLMNMATIVARELVAQGKLNDLEISEENNACSVEVTIETESFNGERQQEQWLLMFKNETHNHPTEIEPFGGASTCLGGAIRDPLSGRSYVYQALRVSGAGDILASYDKTLAGKLSQRKISQEAAQGYASYGNQIGIATSYVNEVYHPGYVAKRMEVGAVVAAAPKENVVRKSPQAGDKIILLGGLTGRDGCGGAAGSSQSHHMESLTQCSAEVQKGNAPEERKIQRLFRRPEVSRLIKKCNDFGAGGVCVAIGELAPGVWVDLDKVPVKYQGLSGTELAISESQERMAIVLDAQDCDRFLALAQEENLRATVVGEVTDNHHLQLSWQQDLIVNIDRDFLNTNGVAQHIAIDASDLKTPQKSHLLQRHIEGENFAQQWLLNMQDDNVAAQKGLGEMFDSSIGRGTVLMPYGGRYQMTPIDVSVMKFPVMGKETEAVSAMSVGFDPALMTQSCYHGVQFAIADSLAKLVAAGIDYRYAHFSFQEYFEKLGQDSQKWAKPFLTMLGAIKAQQQFGLAAIGGKDSMSGSFHHLSVPPSFLSFAAAVGKASDIISPEFKQAGNFVYFIDNPINEQCLFDVAQLKQGFDRVLKGIKAQHIVAAMVIKQGGIAEALSKMAFGNGLGVKLEVNPEALDFFARRPAAMVVESTEPLTWPQAQLLGQVSETFSIQFPQNMPADIPLFSIQQGWLNKFMPVFPSDISQPVEIYPAVKAQPPMASEHKASTQKNAPRINQHFAQPKVLISAFPGTNCEYDIQNIFQQQGGDAEILLFRNLDQNLINQSIQAMENALLNSQIFVLPGGFSAGDEPDGSGKFIAAILQNPRIKAAIETFLAKDGLILGICNGFQALVKSGLLPNAQIGEFSANSPTLTFNQIGRHISQMVETKIVNNHSPWLNSFAIGDRFSIPVSHGEGRFYANDEMLQQLIQNGQIATQYVNFEGDATNEFRFNPNGSTYAIEGITSPCGRIFGKMGHSERFSRHCFKNTEGQHFQNIFLNGVNYFK